MEQSSSMKPNKRYQVINHDPAVDGIDYEIFVNKMPELTSFRLVRKGSSWSESVRDEICLQMDDDGNGVRLRQVNKYVDYAQLAELFILITFMHHYQEGGLYCGTINFVEITKSVEL